MASIHYTTPEGESGVVELTAERMTIGRADDNAIVIVDGSVSSHHAELVLDGSDWYVMDTGSTNGTKVNGERVEQVVLTHGGSFTLGSVECVFTGDETAAEMAAAYEAGAAASTHMTTEGYGAMACDPNLRTGFGEKVKAKGGTPVGLMILGVIAILTGLAAVFLFSSMGV